MSYSFFDLYEAAADGDIKEVRSILAQQPDLIMQQDEFGFGILHGAVQNDDTSLVTMLIEAGANVNGQNKDGIAPLHIVQYPEMAALLVAQGADPNIRSRKGQTPLHTQAAEGDEAYDVIEKLLELGADKSITDNEGKTAADLARSRDADALESLLA
jgi:ankyrin repeat protein